MTKSICGMLIAGLNWSAGAATILDIGTLPNMSDSSGYGISRTGRVVGSSGSKAFRTQKNYPLLGAPGEDLHATLVQVLQLSLFASEAFDIHQYNKEPMEIVGQANVGQVNSWPFWYQESDNGVIKYARLLNTTTGGAAVSVKPDTSGSGGPSVVVGHVYVNEMAHAAYWVVVPTQHWLYDYGNIYFPSQESFATDTDRNRTVGYRGSSTNWQAFIIDNLAYGLSVPSNATASAAYGMHPYGSLSRIVGSYVEGGFERPIYWSYTGSGSSTYTILQVPAGFEHARALAVNDYGQIVGSAWHPNGGEAACQWYYTGGPVTVLGGGSWQLRIARKINSYSVGGKVVGWGFHSGVVRGFVYSP